MSETPKKSVYELPKMVTDNPHGNFEVMLNLVYGKDGWSYIRHGDKDMQITDFCFNELCPKFGCPEFVDQTMTSEAQDEFLSDCVFDGCPVATVYAALSGYGHLRDRLRMHEDAMTNRVMTLAEAQKKCQEDRITWYEPFRHESPIVFPVYVAPIDPTDGLVNIYAFFASTEKEVELYGKTWRCWLKKPTPKEMEATPWES